MSLDELFNTEYKWFTQEEIDNNRQGHLFDQKKVSKGVDAFVHHDEKVKDYLHNLYKETSSEDLELDKLNQDL